MAFKTVNVNLIYPFEENTLTFNVDFENEIRSATVLYNVAANLKSHATNLSRMASYIKRTDCNEAEMELINQIINLSHYHIPFFYPFDAKTVSIPIEHQNDPTYFAATLEKASDQLTEIANRISNSATRMMSEKMTSMLHTTKTKCQFK